ncbi:MAG: DUF3048 domain-containing protein [Eubacterium sp.]|nr:DUF3048 domain-containing protein [Eubacterium sp.]
MKVKVITAILSVVLVAGAGTAAYFYIKQHKQEPKATSAVETTTADPYAGQARSFLTGKYIKAEDAKLRPYAVMINNIQTAIPQYSISNADVIYESPVEGSITRMMAIFQKPDKCKRIGSVRSCRIYFAYMSKEWDSIYVHYGQSKYAKKFLKSKKIDNICSWNGEGAFYRTSDKPAPHNCYASGKGLNKQRKKLKYRKNHNDEYQGTFKFADIDKPYEIPDGENVKDASVKVKVGYSYNNAYYKYNKDNQKYYRYQYGQKHIDKVNNKQLSCTNIIIQYVKTVLYPDGKSLKMTQKGDGKGWYITRGKAMKITWHKDKQKSGQTKYYDENGDEITVNNGKTFVQIVQKEDKNKTKFKGEKKEEATTTKKI